MTESPARVGLIGFGHVGRALARRLQAKGGQFAALLGRETRVTGLATARRGWIASSDGLDLARLVAGGPDAPAGTITTHSGGPDTTAYDMVADLITALRDHPAGGGAAMASRLR